MKDLPKIEEELDNLITDALESEKGVEKLKSFCISIHTQAKEEERESIEEVAKKILKQDMPEGCHDYCGSYQSGIIDLKREFLGKTDQSLSNNKK